MKPENIIFDLDGTLIDSQFDIRESFEKTVQLLYNEKIEITSFRIGPPIEEIIRKTIKNISEQQEKEFIKVFRSFYKNCGYTKTYCYDGIHDLLLKLVINRKRIYIATNKPLYLTRAILKKLDIDHFSDICTIDSDDENRLSKKDMISLLLERNSLDRMFTIMVGDSTSDIISAHENLILSAGVGYGYGETDKILEAQPDFFFETVDQLSDFLLGESI